MAEGARLTVKGREEDARSACAARRSSASACEVRCVALRAHLQQPHPGHAGAALVQQRHLSVPQQAQQRQQRLLLAAGGQLALMRGIVALPAVRRGRAARRLHKHLQTRRRPTPASLPSCGLCQGAPALSAALAHGRTHAPAGAPAWPPARWTAPWRAPLPLPGAPAAPPPLCAPRRPPALRPRDLRRRQPTTRLPLRHRCTGSGRD